MGNNPRKSRAVKSLKTLYYFPPKLQATSLLSAGLSSQAHDVICDELALEAIFSESYQEFKELLGHLADPERSSLIAEWSLKGKEHCNCQSSGLYFKAGKNFLSKWKMLFHLIFLFFSRKRRF